MITSTRSLYVLVYAYIQTCICMHANICTQKNNMRRKGSHSEWGPVEWNEWMVCVRYKLLPSFRILRLLFRLLSEEWIVKWIQKLNSQNIFSSLCNCCCENALKTFIVNVAIYIIEWWNKWLNFAIFRLRNISQRVSCEALFFHISVGLRALKIQSSASSARQMVSHLGDIVRFLLIYESFNNFLFYLK